MLLQIALGIFTLVTVLNIYLASVHQITSALLVLSALNLYYCRAKEIDFIAHSLYLSPIIMTPFIKKKEIRKDWYVINAQNAAVGRLASYISKVLRGKNKPTFNPHIDNGDFVVVTNIDKIKFSGKKFTNKKYYRHTGHPGGIKESTPSFLKEKNKSGEILKLAVKRMLPGGPLAKKQLTKLKIYNGDNHPHNDQKPKVVDFEKLNRKNIIK